MNISLKARVTWSFIISNILVIGLVVTVFHFLNTLNKEIEDVSINYNKKVLMMDEIRIHTISLLRQQRKITSSNYLEYKDVVEAINLCETFTSQLQVLDILYRNPDAKKIIGQMLSYIDSIKLLLSQKKVLKEGRLNKKTIIDLVNKILDEFSEFQDIHYVESTEKDKKTKAIILETKRVMMITLIMGFLFTILLALIVPGKIALPFKKLMDAIRELQNCNFDVNISYLQEDEIGELAREMNKMIHSFKIFDELRSDRVSLENRKFDALANMVKRPVLISNAEGRLTYMNNYSYDLLQVQSQDVINKNFSDARIPKCIIDAFELATKRRAKIDNEVIVIPDKPKTGREATENVESSKKDDKESDKDFNGEDALKVKEIEKAFKGYASIIPIRGKDSSLDYYLMVLSEENVCLMIYCCN